MSRILRGEHWAERLLQALGEETVDIPGWMERNTRVVKRDQHSAVGLLQLGDRNCFLKCYLPKGPLQRLQFNLGRGRGVASYDNALRLSEAGLPVAEPLACLLVGGKVLLLNEGLPDSQDFKSLWLAGLAAERLRALMARIASALGAWHQAGFSHGDCKWSNFLVAKDTVYLVDLESVQAGSSRGERCRDLARFTLNAEDMGLPQEDYAVFLENYLAITSDDWATLLPGVRRILLPLRSRHLEKYGPRGHTLI